MLFRSISYLKKLYKEIVLGFSVYDYAGKPIFIKHFSEIDNGYQEAEKEKFYKIGKENGLQEREEKLNFLIETGCWTAEKEREIEQIKKEISDAELVLKNLIIKRQILQAKEKIRKLNERLDEILKEKSEIFGLCVEDFVAKKMNELVIFNSFFKDDKCQIKFFSEEEFDKLSEKDLGDLIFVLNNFYITFSHNQIKRICACPFFGSLLGLSDNNVYNFFGRRIVDLTVLQVNLFLQGKYFKDLIQSKGPKSAPPSDVFEDPDKMIEWYDQLSDDQSTSSDGVSYVGASKEELKKMAGENSLDLQEFAKKKGNSMNTKDFIEMHGL